MAVWWRRFCHGRWLIACTAQAHREVGPADMQSAYRGVVAVAKPQAAGGGLDWRLLSSVVYCLVVFRILANPATFSKQTLTPALSRGSKTRRRERVG
jgi:hypothetical protein